MLNAFNAFDVGSINAGLQSGMAIGRANSPFTGVNNALQDVLGKYNAHLASQAEHARKLEQIRLTSQLEGQNQIANTTLVGKNALENTTLSGDIAGKNQIANTTLEGENALTREKQSGQNAQANTRLSSKLNGYNELRRTAMQGSITGHNQKSLEKYKYNLSAPNPAIAAERSTDPVTNTVSVGGLPMYFEPEMDTYNRIRGWKAKNPRALQMFDFMPPQGSQTADPNDVNAAASELKQYLMSPD